MNLAELLAEARRLDEAATFAGRKSVPWEEFCDAGARVDAFYAEHGPRLLAVAEAAATALGAWDGVSTEEESRLPASFVNAMRQLDAAASGEGRG